MISDLQTLPSAPCIFSPKCVIGKVGGGVSTVTKTIEFTKDPLGYIATQEQKAVVDISNQVFPAFVKLLHPDLTVDWFLDAYKVSFAIGLILFGFLMLSDFLNYRRGQMGPSEFLDNVIFYVPAYIIGALVGPAVGNFLCQVVGALCDGLIGWGGGSQGINGAGQQFTKLLAGSSPAATLGGAIITAILFFIMIIAFVLILVTLLFMFVTLYLSGAVFPVGWAWIVKGSHRETAFKIVRLWGGILLSQPLVFFMLAVVMKMVSNNLFGLAEGGAGTSPLTRLVGLIGGCMALLMVAAGPFTLNKLAPIGVGGATSGTSLGQMSSWAGKGTGSGIRGGGGESSDSDSQMGQASRSGGGGGGGGEASGGEAAAGGSEAAAAAGPLGLAAMAASEQSGDDSGGGVGGDTLLDKASGKVDEASGEVSGQMDDANAAGSEGAGSDESGSQGSSLSDAASGGGDSGGDGGDSDESGSQGSSLSDAANGGGGGGDGADSGSGSGSGVSLAKASDSAPGADIGGGGGDDAGGDSADGGGGSSEGGGGFGSKLMEGAKAGGSAASSMAQGASSLGGQISAGVTEHMDHQDGGHDR